MALPLGPVLLLKELADFIQIGLVSWQTGKRFSESRSGQYGSVGIDGGTVRIQGEGFSLVLPLDDAAREAGVAGVAGKGTRGVREAAVRARRGGRVAYASALERGEPAAQGVYQRHVAVGGEQGATSAARPDLDSRPFTAREFIAVQEVGKSQRQGTAIDAERQLETLREGHALRLAGITDARLREQMALQFAEQERRLETQVMLTRERLAADERGAEQRFRHQVALDEAEREWKGTQAVADRVWRERTGKEAAEIGFYRVELAKDLAVTRAAEAAKKIGEAQRAVVGLSFAPGFQFGRISRG